MGDGSMYFLESSDNPFAPLLKAIQMDNQLMHSDKSIIEFLHGGLKS